MKVFNVTRGFYMKYRVAVQAIESCSGIWVEQDKTIRDLAPAEAIRARNLKAQARAEEIIPDTEFKSIAKPIEYFDGSWADIYGRCADTPKANFCEICEVECSTVYDHCHKTEIFRGWLCGRCNSMLGFALDSPQVLRNAADYLEKFSKKLKDRGVKDGIALPSGQSQQRV